MSEVFISESVRHLDRIALEVFRGAQDEIAREIAANWKGQIIHVQLIDTGNYLQSVRVTDTEESGDSRTVMIEAPEAGGYAGVIKRKGESDYVGRRVAERGIERSEGAIGAIMDRAGNKLK
ncbi:MAG TPA: hypothetical protein VGB17_02880 [Pyrinomonadaceae bacterium]|jgi:hypothetical protein